MNPTRRKRRRARAVVIVIAVISGLAVGAVGGYLLPERVSEGGASQATEAADQQGEGESGEKWYTCGMHPNVLQKGPGICPICQMKLTPRKEDKADEGAGAAGASQERKVLYWRAPMDPGYISEKPGKSPMGMDLVPVYADEAESAGTHSIRIDPVTIQNMGIRTQVVERGPLVKTIRALGRVDYDEQRVSFVDTKFSGWIEELHVDETGQFVEKGQPLFDVYSPELYAAQEEYLAAIRSLPRLENSKFAAAREEAGKLVEAAVTKLKYLDVSDEQIARMRETKRIEKTLMIHSPARGIVTEKMALQGMHVKPGMRLYTIADLSRVWVYVDVYEYQLPWVRVGQTAWTKLPYIPGREFTGQVVYIYPYLEQQSRVIKVRLEFDNPAFELKPGMYANVSLESELQRDALLIPRQAYIDSGTRKVAFVDRGNGKFQPREIQVGVEAEGGMVEVLYGLDAGEVVVTSGQFLLDAESKLKEAAAKMREVDRAKTTKRGPEDAAVSQSGQEPTTGIPEDARFACPMDEHPSQEDPAKQGAYFAEKPGRCPWCNMELKPLDELDWVKVRRAARGGDVAYTCPDHQHVFSEEPGECPRCGKTLEPFKVMYTCPDPEHAGVISTFAANCPQCGRGLAAYRGIWLDEQMAADNVPPTPSLAETAPYRCPIHPLVHSDKPGHCTICAKPLESTEEQVAEAKPDDRQIPADAAYTCPMKVCWQFSSEVGECSVCGMQLQPMEEVEWVREMRAAEADHDKYICPMHPEEHAAEPGTCSICGMQLVEKATFEPPQAAPEQVAAQVNYLTEHYLEITRLLAADKTAGVARNALGLVSASEELARHLDDPDVDLPDEVAEATQQLHKAALKIRGDDLAHDRVALVELSEAMRTIFEHARPDTKRWPRLYIYHCPMSKGDWIQSSKEKRNPYYGFQMLDCGELQDVK